MICHYVRLVDEGDWDALLTEVKAICGDKCLIPPEGTPMPADFDFVSEPDPFKQTTCKRCLAELDASPPPAACVKIPVPA